MTRHQHEEKKKEHQYHFDSIQLHGGQHPDSDTHARAVPIYASTSYVQKTLDDMYDVINFKKEAYLYTR